MVFALTTFALAAFVIVLLPGPDTLVTLRSLVRGGRPQAARTVGGILCGLTVWVAAASLGLSTLLRASHDGYTALRFAGAAYLIWLGVQSLRMRASAPDAPSAATAGTKRTSLLGGGFFAGLATDLLNPKVGVFFVTFLPGFVPSGYSVGWTSALLGLIFVVETGLYFAVLLSLASRVTAWMSNRRIRRRLDRTTGLILLGLGARLALEP
ncbi:MAG: putative threonine efflux protein [Frankiales bacterium]|nr:putative threonine efflux protein [Frankiales bacterium]